MGYIRLNPLEAVTLPRIEKVQIKPMEDDDLTRFLKEIKGNPYELVFFVTVFTGLRQGEILGLTWDCVNFEKNTLFINKQHGKIKGGKEYVFSSLSAGRSWRATVGTTRITLSLRRSLGVISPIRRFIWRSKRLSRRLAWRMCAFMIYATLSQ